MSSMNKKVCFEDYTFLVDENVYEPAEDSFLFAENLPTEETHKVIDMGAGCGILGVIGAKRANEVLAVDVNPYAVRCAKQNARLNGVFDKFVFIQGDLFCSVAQGAKFDLILFNAPYLPLENEDASWVGRSWAGGKTGREVIDRFIDQAPGHLSSNGQILLMQSSLSNIDQTLRRYASRGLNANVVASRVQPFFETILLTSAKQSVTSK